MKMNPLFGFIEIADIIVLGSLFGAMAVIVGLLLLLHHFGVFH